MMTVTAAGTGTRPARRESPAAPDDDRLMPLSRASTILGFSVDALREWIVRYGIPAVKTPGGSWSTYASWVDAVMSSARPGAPGSMAQATDDWWARRLPQAVAL
jgi:hypothetical protein